MKVFNIRISKITKKFLIAVLVFAITLGNTVVVYANDFRGYYHGGNIQTNNSDWMKELPDSVFVSELSIPGTHETMAIIGGDFAQCQSLDLTEQLVSGIRALDIRCRHIDNKFAIHHGPVYQEKMFGDVLNACKDFLSKHPEEVIFMRIKEERLEDVPIWNGFNCSRSFDKTFDEYYQNYMNLFWKVEDDKVPTLGEVRGKVVILQNFDSPKKYGLEYGGDIFDEQDNYEPSSQFSKWSDVKNHLLKTNAAEAKDRKIFLNYLSANKIMSAFPNLNPWFVSSGNVTKASNGKNLCAFKFDDGQSNDFPKKSLTYRSVIYELLDLPDAIFNLVVSASGLAVIGDIKDIVDEIPDWAIELVLGSDYSFKDVLKNIVDFVDYIGIDLDDRIGTVIYYEGTNELFSNKISEQSIKRAGIVMADFPGPKLIENIININKRHCVPVVEATVDAGYDIGEDKKLIYTTDEFALKVNFKNKTNNADVKHIATVYWGDASETRVEVNDINYEAYDTASGIVSGSFEVRHKYAEVGQYDIKVSVQVDNNYEWPGVDHFATDVHFVPVLKNQTLNSPVFSGETVTVNADFLDKDFGETHTASINWGDGYTDQLDVLYKDSDDITGSITGKHKYYIPDKYTVTIEITDKTVEQGIEATDSETLNVEVLYFPVTVEIKEIGSDDDVIKVDAKGRVPVTIFSQDNFDATTIIQDTVKAGPNEIAPRKITYDDYNHDGISDAKLFFEISDLGFVKNDTELIITGQISDGRYFQGFKSFASVPK